MRVKRGVGGEVTIEFGRDKLELYGAEADKLRQALEELDRDPELIEVLEQAGWVARRPAIRVARGGR